MHWGEGRCTYDVYTEGEGGGLKSQEIRRRHMYMPPYLTVTASNEQCIQWYVLYRLLLLHDFFRQDPNGGGVQAS